ncbi:type II secretion system F family protein [Cryptosporangium phraense]|uniref:type II secretion system F family protein n=1 Tax=Cryptosporangium phraense TaxID=2593070 RepID=UPI003B846758
MALAVAEPAQPHADDDGRGDGVNLRLIAGIGGALVVAGVVLGVFALIGTSAAARPTSSRALWWRRVWNGDGLSASERRTRQALLLGALAAGAVAWLFTRMPIAGLLAALAVPGVPWLFTVGNREKRAIQRIESVGEWARRLKDITATGVGLQQAIVSSTATAPVAITTEIKTLAARLQAGWNGRIALLRFADDIADPVCDQVVAALILHLSDRGEHLGDVLNSIASAAAAEVATRREVEAKRTQPRFAVRFLTGLTLLVLVYGASRPDYMAPYGTTTGQLVMAGLGGVFIGLLIWVRAMSLPPRAPRFLSTPGEAE